MKVLVNIFIDFVLTLFFMTIIIPIGFIFKLFGLGHKNANTRTKSKSSWVIINETLNDKE